ncbi:hypothetical protein AB0J80_29085 [Actinoplanes sp. NPDC049548]|uniref:hypothetical protein n=1 Tax=Actinoplanes sp. NPDC049548 TaxID=3155152 RepID=UPI003425774E
MSLRQVRRRCERVARSIEVPDPFDIELLLATLGTRRGRPIVLLPFDLPTGAPSGLCVAAGTADYLVVTSSATGTQRDHIVLHELAHLLLGHQLQALDPDAGGQLFQHLDPAVIRTMLGRTTYSTVEEQEAEILASLLGQRAHPLAPPAPDSGSDPVVQRLGRSLEHG